MSITTQDLVGSNTTIESHKINQEDFLAEPHSASGATQELKIVDPLVEPNNIELTPSERCKSHQTQVDISLQIHSQQARLRDLIEQKATIMTPEQVQRLQACVQQIAAIVHEQPPARGKRFKHSSCRLTRY